MARIYLIRHAESVANTRGVYQGQTYDTDLSLLGRNQGMALKSRFATEKFDTIYTSPLKRTSRTAWYLGEAVSEPDLIETNHGEWEGLSKAEIQSKWPDLYNLWLTRPAEVRFPGGEHFTQTAGRVTSWLNRISQKQGSYAAITHGNVIQVALACILGLDLNSIWNFVPQPTAVTLIESHSPARIIYLNDTSHQKGLESDLNTHAI